MTPLPNLFCFGLGYTASITARLLAQQGWNIHGTHRDGFNADMPLPSPNTLQDVTHLLISIPPDDKGDIALRHHRQLITQLPSLIWIGYLSTTGVYGGIKGEWVDETSPVNPPNQRLRNRVLAEQQWLSLYEEYHLPVHIFRLSGIYGPGRSALDAIGNGTARRIDKKHQYFSRIHVEDIAQILIASIHHPQPGNIYNAADNYPCPQEEVVRFAAELLGVAPPPLVAFEQADLSPMARSFYRSSRRVRNEKIKQELGVVLKYPSYKEGLRTILENLP